MVELKNLIREKHRLKNGFDKNPITFGDRYKDDRKKVGQSLKQCKTNYFNDKFLTI